MLRKEFLGEISGLAEEILDSSDLKQPGQNEFNLKTFKRKLEQLYLPQAESKGVEFRVKIIEKNVDVLFSKNKLIQITGNLLSNAIKFTPENGQVIVELLLIEDENLKRLHINVTDTGVGIDENQLAEIHGGEGTSTNGTSGECGYGFGLPLVKHLVETLKGSLDIHSQVGKGTTFKVVLPME